MKAYLSALGSMGRRHLKGLVRAGFDVYACDPNRAAFDIARKELQESGLPMSNLMWAESSQKKYDVAIFSETTPDRLGNFSTFLAQASAKRILLEKPLSADPADFERFLAAASQHGVSESTHVNFLRRTWRHVRLLSDLCASENNFTVTLNGGAVGLGCMGIHYLDTFLFLSSGERASVVWSRLSNEPVISGRGEQFLDYGGEFVVQGVRGTLLAALSATSSANVVMTVRGTHLIATVDYSDFTWKLVQRKRTSAMPKYRYGADYEVIEEGALDIPAMDLATESWALGREVLPTLNEALASHNLLIDVLKAGGAQPPYRFT